MDAHRHENIKTPSKLTLADLGEQIGFRSFHVYSFLICLLISMVPPFIVSPVPYIIEDVMLQFGLTSASAALLSTCLTLGAVIGSPLAGWISDQVGRRATVALCLVWSLLTSVVQFFAPTYFYIVALRCLQGLSFGGLTTIVGLYIMEFFPDSGCGPCLALLNLAWPLGGLCCIGLVELTDSWRMCLAFPAVPSLLGLIALLFLPESPRWFLSAGYTDEGKNVISFILQHCPLDGTVTSCDLRAEIHVEPYHAITSTSIVQLFKPHLFHITMIAMSLYMATGAFTYSFFIWGPRILAAATGHASVPLGVFAFAEVITIIASLGVLAIIDVTGRRSLLLSAFVAGIVLPIALASRPSLLIGIAIWLALQTQQVVMWIAVGTYTAEVYSSECRGSGVGLANMCCRICAAVAPILSGLLLNMSYVPVLIMAASSSVFGLIASLSIPWDTTGHLDDEKKEATPLLPNWFGNTQRSR